MTNITPEINDAIREWLKPLTVHANHKRRQVGPCVYCADCGIRLYQGKLEDTQ